MEAPAIDLTPPPGAPDPPPMASPPDPRSASTPPPNVNENVSTCTVGDGGQQPTCPAAEHAQPPPARPDHVVALPVGPDHRPELVTPAPRSLGRSRPSSPCVRPAFRRPARLRGQPAHPEFAHRAAQRSRHARRPRPGVVDHLEPVRPPHPRRTVVGGGLSDARLDPRHRLGPCRVGGRDHCHERTGPAHQRLADGAGTTRSAGRDQRGCRPEGPRARHRSHGRHRELRRRPRPRPRPHRPSRPTTPPSACTEAAGSRSTRTSTAVARGWFGPPAPEATPAAVAVMARPDPRRHTDGGHRRRRRARPRRPLLGHSGGVADGPVRWHRSRRCEQRPADAADPQPSRRPRGRRGGAHARDHVRGDGRIARLAGVGGCGALRRTAVRQPRQRRPAAAGSATSSSPPSSAWCAAPSTRRSLSARWSWRCCSESPSVCSGAATARAASRLLPPSQWARRSCSPSGPFWKDPRHGDETMVRSAEAAPRCCADCVWRCWGRAAAATTRRRRRCPSQRCRRPPLPHHDRQHSRHRSTSTTSTEHHAS